MNATTWAIIVADVVVAIILAQRIYSIGWDVFLDNVRRRGGAICALVWAVMVAAVMVVPHLIWKLRREEKPPVGVKIGTPEWGVWMRKARRGIEQWKNIKYRLLRVYMAFGGENEEWFFYLEETITLREFLVWRREWRATAVERSLDEVAFIYAGGLSSIRLRPKMRDANPILNWATARMSMSFARFSTLNAMWRCYAGRG